MDNVHLTNEVLKRLNSNSGKTQSSINKLAYNCASKIEFEGNVFNWTTKQEDDFKEEFLLKPKNCLYQNSLEIFKDVEKKEKRADAQLAYNITISLDHSLDYQTNKKVLVEFLEERFIKGENVPCSVAIHDKNGANLHAHVLIPMRRIEEDGYLAKNKIQDSFNNKKSGFFTLTMREEWAELINRERAKQGILEKISTKSNQEKAKELLAKGDLVGAVAKNYPLRNKPKLTKYQRKLSIKKAKERKEQAKKDSLEIEQKQNRLKEIFNEISETEQLKKDIIKAAQDIANQHSESQRILNKALNMNQIIEQQRQQKITSKFKY